MSDQCVHLATELVACPVVVDDDVGLRQAGRPVGLTGEARPGVGFGEPSLVHQSFHGKIWIDVDHHQQFEVVTTGFDEEGDVQDHRDVGGFQRGQSAVDLGTDSRMDDGVQARQLVDIGEHPCGEPRSVQLARCQQDVVAEFGDDRREDGLAGSLQFMGDGVGVDDFEAACGEHRGHRGLATADSAGQSDETHGRPGYCVTGTPTAEGT